MQMSAAPTLSPALFRRNPQFVLIMQGALAEYKLTQSSQAQAVTVWFNANLYLQKWQQKAAANVQSSRAMAMM